MTTYLIEYEDRVALAKLRDAAKARGIDVDDNDDWYQPEDIVRTREHAGTLESARKLARRIAKGAVYGQARILEEYQAEDLPAGVMDHREVETVDVSEPASRWAQ